MTLNTQERVDLLPCPFCGGEAKYVPHFWFEGNEAGDYTICTQCGAESGRRLVVSDPDTIAAWNTRITHASMPDTAVRREDFLGQLRRVNADRYHAWVGKRQDAGILFDAAELGGEVGELLNVVKKLVREEAGWRGSRAAPEDFADECGDVLICLDKLARRRGVDLAEATARKFNATSDKQGFPHKLAALATHPTPAPNRQYGYADGVPGTAEYEPPARICDRCDTICTRCRCDEAAVATHPTPAADKTHRVEAVSVDDEQTRSFIDGWNARLDHDDFDMALHYWKLSLVRLPAAADEAGDVDRLREACCGEYIAGSRCPACPDRAALSHGEASNV